MNQFLERLYKKPQLDKLKNWGDRFWESYAEKKASNFAQQGYEDKGCGHIERIISNVGELLENYCQILYRLNHPNDDPKTIRKIKDNFEKEFIDHLDPNLVMFYTAAILHDIGMNFPGIFKALKKVITTVGESALHIGEIIHNYHHYSSFIVLLEIKHIADLEKRLKKPDRFLDKVKKNNNHNEVEKIVEKKMAKISQKCPFLENIPDNVKIQSIRDLLELYVHLHGIYIEYFSEPGKNGFNEKEFFVILAILCLLHKEVNPENVQSILRKFSPLHEETIHYFNKWWSFFNRAREWTETAPQWLQGKLGPEEKEIFPELITFKKFPGKKLNLLLVEALLQYGDKTEITIARLARNPKECGEKIQGDRIPLEDFRDDIQWDNRKGFICTNMAKRIISDFARFRACRFIPLFLVKVEHDIDVNHPRLDVIMHYFRFANDEDVFQVLRYHNEKDFYDLKFLEVIKIHIPILLSYLKKKINRNPILDINFRKMEHQFPTLEGELKRHILYFFGTEKGNTILQQTINKEDVDETFTGLKAQLEKYIDEFLHSVEGEKFHQKIVREEPPPDLNIQFIAALSSKLETNECKETLKKYIKGEHQGALFYKLDNKIKKLLEDFIRIADDKLIFKEAGNTITDLDAKLKGVFQDLLENRIGKKILKVAICRDTIPYRFYGLDSETKSLFVNFLETKTCKEVLQKEIDEEPKELKFQALPYEIKKFFTPFITAKIGKEILKKQERKPIDQKYHPRVENLVNELRDLLVDFIKKQEDNGIAQKVIKEADVTGFFRLNYEQKKQLINFLTNLEEKEILEEIRNKSIKYLFLSLEDRLKQELIDFLNTLKIQAEESTEQSLYDLSNEQKKRMIEFIKDPIKGPLLQEIQLYGLDEDMEGILFGFFDTLKGLGILQENIEEARDKNLLEDIFPYTPQNKEAIFKFSQSILNPEVKNKTMGRRKVFYESCDLIVPSSFELMAILNLFLKEE